MAVIPQALIAKEIAQRSGKEASKVSRTMLGFDFIPLITSLFIFYTIAFLFSKYMEASKFASGGFIAFANLIGFNIPPPEELPNSWNKLFDEEGLNGVKWWDLINIIAIVIIVATAFQFNNNTKAKGDEVQPITWAIFGLMVSFIVITGVSKLVTKLQQRNFQSEFR